MSAFDQLSETIEAFYSAAADEDEWVRPLNLLTNLCGGMAATLELVDLQQKQPVFFQNFGLNTEQTKEYLNHFQMISPRMRHGQRAGCPNICYDYQFISEAEMDHDPFYAEFLVDLGMRYFLAGTVEHNDNQLAFFSVQRSPGQGHADKGELAIIDHMVPHVRRALDLSLRLQETADHANQLEHALDYHFDGVVLISHDGSVAQANIAAQAIFRSADGVAVRGGRMKLADRAAAKLFNRALRAVANANDLNPWPETEFLAARKSGGLPYSLSMHPAHTLTSAHKKRYLAIIFIRDLDRQRRLSYKRTQTILGLTPTEAQLAVWIAGGGTLEAFAHRRDISMNTVYTHCRHLKEKAGCRTQTTLAVKIRQIAE